MKKAGFLLELFLFLFLTGIFSESKGQEKIDSMLTVLKKSKHEDTARVNLLNELAWEYQTTDPVKGLEYAVQGEKIAVKLGYSQGIAKSYLSSGVCYYVKSEYEKALADYSKALKITEEIGDKSTSATIYLNIGNIYFNRSDFKTTLDNYNKAFACLEEINDKSRCAAVYGNIGNLYYVQGNYTKSLEYQFKALQLAEKSKNLKVQGNSLSGIGNIYSRLPDYPKALEYYFKSLKIHEINGNKTGSASAYGSIGIIYFRQKSYQKAIDYLTIAGNLSAGIGDLRGTAITFTNIGNVYSDQNNYTKALESHQKALKLFTQINLKSNIASSYNNIARVYTQLRNFTQALEYYQKAYDLNCELNIKSGILYSFKGMAELYLAMAKFHENPSIKTDVIKLPIPPNECINLAISYAKKAVVMGRELNELDPLIETYSIISQGYKIKNDWKNAFLYADSSRILQDSVYNYENQRKISDLEAARAEELKMKEIKIISLNIQHQRVIITSVTIGLIMMILIALLIYRSLLIKKKYNRILEETVALRTAELRESNEKLTQAKNELEVLDLAKNEFLQIIQHEIRTPLNGILGPVDILKTADSPELKTRMVEILNVSVRRLELFSLKTLDISELRTKGQAVIKPGMINITELITRDFEQIRKENLKKQVEFRILSDPKDLMVNVDKIYFSKMMKEILENAVRHSPENGVITVEVAATPHEFQCTVKDQGTGFAEKQLQSPMAAFNVNKHLDTNPGLGLYLASLIIQAHKGNLQIGNHPGGGAMVNFIIPL